ncbi:MAG: acyloxyacyl hydrolase, partial [Gemmatimonadaceae bacterium]
EASGGGLWFSRRIPDPVATRFNFTASAGPALELRLTPSQSLRAGYLWHHTSNGGTGKVNPGLNSGILALGVLWHASDGAAQ